MKKLLLVISFIIPLLFTSFNSLIVKGEEEIEEVECGNISNTRARIINNYNDFKGNGFVYKSDDKYTYVVSSSKIVTDSNNFSVMYDNGEVKEAVIIGYDSYNEVAIFRTSLVKEVNGVCLGNSNFLYKGQVNYIDSYIDKENEYYVKAFLGNIGVLYYSEDNIRIYKSVVSVSGSEYLFGSGVFDLENRLIGMISGYNSRIEGGSYMVESNKLVKIADSIIKTGNYKVNYIKYNIADYSSLSSRVRDFYGVSSKASEGVVITTFKPFNYIFGGLNQGMVITEVNGVEVSNTYEFDKQISRYDKKSKVCLSVVKKNGKKAYYYVKV